MSKQHAIGHNAQASIHLASRPSVPTFFALIRVTTSEMRRPLWVGPIHMAPKHLLTSSYVSLGAQALTRVHRKATHVPEKLRFSPAEASPPSTPTKSPADFDRW